MEKFNFVNPKDFWDKDIFKLMGLKNVPEDKKKEMMDSMMRTVQNRVLARILDSMEEVDVKEFEKLIKDGDNEKTNAFLESKNINLTQISAEEAMLYKTELINMVAAGPQATKK